MRHLEAILKSKDDRAEPLKKVPLEGDTGKAQNTPRLAGLTNGTAFTVDLEDWYQGLEIGPETWGSFADRLRVGSDRLLRLLDAASVQATFFVLGYAAERDPDLIREIQDQGHEIGTHGYAHRLVYQLDSEEFKRDIERSLETLSAIVSGPIRTHRAPFFSITKQSEWAFDVLAECGIECDSSVFPVQNYRYGIADAPRWQYQVRPGLTEFPLSTYRLNGRNIPVGGGAYFRIFPYVFKGFRLILDGFWKDS